MHTTEVIIRLFSFKGCGCPISVQCK